MAIRIIDDQPDVVLTRSEHQRLMREYESLTHMVDKPDFETWVRRRMFNVEMQKRFPPSPYFAPTCGLNAGTPATLPPCSPFDLRC